MASHARLQSSRISRTLLRTALAVSAAGAALAAGSAATASAAPPPKPKPAPPAQPDKGLDSTVTRAVGNSVVGAPGAVKNLPLNPLANTGVDPLANGLEVQAADFKPVGTTTVTGPLSRGAALKDLPVAGTVTKALPS